MNQANHEERVLGAALAESGLWLRHAPTLTPELFSTYHVLGRELLAMTEHGKATDPQSVQTHLSSRGIEVQISNLMRLQDHAPFNAHSMAVAVDSLRETAKRRALSSLGAQLVEQAKQAGAVDAKIEAAAGRLADIGAAGRSPARSFGDVLKETVSQLGAKRRGVQTGISQLDHFTGGLKPGELVALGARPSMGKTALALGVAVHAARAGHSVLVFSLEMSAASVCQRILSMLSQVNLAKIVTQRVSQRDVELITTAASLAHKWSLHVATDATGIDPVCRQIKHQHGLDLVIVDYLQLMSVRAESREQQIATISRSLKRLAGALSVPVLVLSQLNRQLEARSSKRPQLSDFRESGAIEQDADLALLLWRPAYYDDAEDPAAAELILAKNRNGPTGDIELEWSPKLARFQTPKTA